MSREIYHCNFIYNNIEINETEDNLLATSFVHYLDRKICGWGFKCYLAERDCLAGRNVFDELFRTVSETEKCLVIITPDFRRNYWAKYCKQAAFKYLLQEEHQHKMIPITLNIDDTGSLKELNVNDPIHIKGSNEMEWGREINEMRWQKLKKTLEAPHVAEERGDNRLRTERQQLQVTEPSSATNMSNISLFPTEQGDNRLRTERQQLLVTVPSSAINMTNNSFFPTEQGDISEVGSEENTRSTEQSSFVSVDGFTSSLSLPDNRHNNMPLPRQEGINQQDDVDHLLIESLTLDTVDGAPNMNRFDNLNDVDLSIDTSPAETDNPRPETIGGDESPIISGNTEVKNNSASFLDVTGAQDETDLKLPLANEDTSRLSNQRHLNQISAKNSPDSGYTTPSESISRPICSNIENRSENQTDDQKIKPQDNSLTTDSVKVKPQLVQSSTTSDVIRPPAASLPMTDEKKSGNALSKIGAFLSLAMESFSNSDLAFK